MSHYNSLANEIRRTCDAADVSNAKATQQEIDDLFNLSKSAAYSAEVLKGKLEDATDAGLKPISTSEIDAREFRIAQSAQADKAAVDAQNALGEAQRVAAEAASIAEDAAAAARE